MVFKTSIFVSLLICCSTIGTQQCVPEPAFHILVEGTTLRWDASTNCESTSYIVTIHAHNVGAVEYMYQSDLTTLDLSFLPFCRSYIFTVSPISGNLVGPYSQILTAVPLPADVNITITNFTSSQIDNDVLLEWSVLPQYSYCPESYQILLWSEDDTNPQEISTSQSGYYINDIAHCMSYQIEISVKYSSREHPTSHFNYSIPAATNTPSLWAVRQDAVTINTTWALESYTVNRCNVTALHIAGTGFNDTILIVDVPERPTIDVSIRGLKANSMYYFNVTIENEAGISRPYQMAVQTLPIETDSFERLYDLDYK